MRRALFVLAGLAAFFVSTQSVALAGGCHPHHHHGRVVYRAPAVYRPVVAAYPYAVPYYANPYVYNYPSAAIGVSGRNFSLWFQR